MNALGALALAYAAVCAWVYLTQERLVFIPDRTLRWSPAEAELPYEDVYLETADGETVHGWYLPPTPDPAAGPVPRRHVLFFHGNGGNISGRPRTLALLHGFGVGVLAIDYRGYGQSSGRPSEHGTLLDAEAAWAHLLEDRGLSPGDIVVYGRSLGGAVAMALAARHSPAGLVVESSFTHLVDLGRHHYPWLPVRLLSRIRYDSLALAGSLRCPVLMAHSPDDEVVPYALGRALADAVPTLVGFVALEGGHNSAFVLGAGGWHSRLEAFIRTPGRD